MKILPWRNLSIERKLVWALVLIVGGAMFTPAAKALLILFPVGSLYVGYRALRTDNALFGEFVTWLFFLTPFLRRVVDYETNAREMIIISTPFLVLLIPLMFVLVRWKKAISWESAPFCYAIAAVLYGAFVACAHSQFSSAAAGLIMWIPPITFALFLLLERDRISDVSEGIERAILGGTFVAGIYGLIQYFYIPAWDAAWMRSVDMDTIGKPEAMEVRVFSTLNSPQILASFLLVGILLAYRLRSRWKYLILLAGIASLVLSAARSAWIGLFAGLMFLAFRGSSAERVRTLFATAGCTLLILVALNVPELSDTISARFNTFSDLKHDESALDRKETYTRVSELLQHSLEGSGLGVDNGMADAQNDSSVVAVLLGLGLPGSLIFATALGVCAFKLLFTRSARELPQLLGLQCCITGLAFESPLNNVVNGQIGFLLWSMIGLSYGFLMKRKAEISSELKVGVVLRST
jgi:hypothetical protein